MSDFRRPATQIAFIDANVPDRESLISGLQPDVQFVILDPTKDGVEQITAALKGGNFSAVHIVSHGSEGSIQLGNSILNAQTLETQYAPSLQQWRESLTPDADILLYGCKVGADSQGDTTRLGLKPQANSESRLKPTQSASNQSVSTDLGYETGNLFPGGLAESASNQSVSTDLSYETGNLFPGGLTTQPTNFLTRLA
ncbi:DUF4347 domain-containing protein [Microseira sp. BLCC-F43]|jgi:hypothetical protein|uniref:DUF4347 domain-containing protein n=1 Tax=Microseira sp. BLCC-F43 TaxID=3153602 RepID=UPI0035B78CDB